MTAQASRTPKTTTTSCASKLSVFFLYFLAHCLSHFLCCVLLSLLLFLLSLFCLFFCPFFCSFFLRFVRLPSPDRERNLGRGEELSFRGKISEDVTLAGARRRAARRPKSRPPHIRPQQTTISLTATKWSANVTWTGVFPDGQDFG